jgi:hypothetical protein
VEVLDVPCAGDDPPILVLHLVCPRSEHFVDDERPLEDHVWFENRWMVASLCDD